MANWCSNWVIFHGDEKTLSNIQELFSAMKAREEETGHGQLPEFAGPDDRHFFNIYFEQDNPGVFQYETKWVDGLCPRRPLCLTRGWTMVEKSPLFSTG